MVKRVFVKAVCTLQPFHTFLNFFLLPFIKKKKKDTKKKTQQQAKRKKPK